MKKIIFLLSLLLVFGVLVYGEEKITTLKGVIKYDSNIHHSEITVEGKTYELMMPEYLLRDIKEGDTVEVEGYVIDEKTLSCCGYAFQKDKDEEFFYVTKLTHNGKTVNIDEQRGRMMHRGFRGRGRW